jgi:hemin uptake protein HemP
MAETSQPTHLALPADTAAGPARSETVRAVSSDMLFDGTAEVQIDHHGTLYRLRLTSLGKLILTK